MTEINLFDYQEDMVGRVREAFKRHDSVMVQMPTGTGKTHVLAAIVGRFLKKDVWVVAHRRELVVQIKDTLGRFFPALDSEKIKVMSIQWLSRHYRELKEKPCLIVIDEAHHALAETYAEVMNAYPKAKKLGLTATPCRMNGRGFTDLFDTLLCSWSMERFIAEGRLSLYDYYSIKPDSDDQLLIYSLQKRGADGDYQQKELNEVMDVRPSLERLCLTVKEYVPGKKGIVYAISIQHAEHIAELYRENGIKAVAISSKTPLAERKKLIERFKSSSFHSSSFDSSLSSSSLDSSLHSSSFDSSLSSSSFDSSLHSSSFDSSLPSSLKSDSNSSDEIEILVSVDLFSEGFDCPDVEFIQLARPTLSLAKYMQMVGRGLRVAEGKDYCVILDNVGLYKRFGLPSVDRDWRSMFEGRDSLQDMLQEVCLNVNTLNCRMDTLMGGDERLMKITGHEWQQRMSVKSHAYRLVENERGLLGIVDEDGNGVLDCRYRRIDLTDDGFAYCYIRKKPGRKEWLDLRNGLWFMRKPQSVRLLGIDFCTEDGKRLYPRIRSNFIDEKAFLTVKTLELQVGTGLSWKRRFIAWDEPCKVYMYQKGEGNSRLYIDEAGLYYIQKNAGSRLVKVDSPEELAVFAENDRQEREKAAELLRSTYAHYEFYPLDDFGPSRQLHGSNKYNDKIMIEQDGIWHIENDWHHESYWVDPVTRRKHYTRPSLCRRGFVNILKEGDWCYIRNIPGLKYRPLRQWEIVADDNICVVDNEFLFVREEPRIWFKICIRTDDFTCFVVKEYDEYKDMDEQEEIQITQFEGDGVKISYKDGRPYTFWVPRHGYVWNDDRPI